MGEWETLEILLWGWRSWPRINGANLQIHWIGLERLWSLRSGRSYVMQISHSFLLFFFSSFLLFFFSSFLLFSHFFPDHDKDQKRDFHPRPSPMWASPDSPQPPRRFLMGLLLRHGQSKNPWNAFKCGYSSRGDRELRPQQRRGVNSGLSLIFWTLTHISWAMESYPSNLCWGTLWQRRIFSTARNWIQNVADFLTGHCPWFKEQFLETGCQTLVC